MFCRLDMKILKCIWKEDIIKRFHCHAHYLSSLVWQPALFPITKHLFRRSTKHYFHTACVTTTHMGSICSIFINESTLAMIHENVFGKGGGGAVFGSGLLKGWEMFCSLWIWLARQVFIALCKTFRDLMCNRLPSLCSAVLRPPHYKHASPAIQHPLGFLQCAQFTWVKRFHISLWQLQGTAG